MFRWQRDCEALERLQKHGLKKKNPAGSVVATLFGEGPDICWLAQNGPLSPIPKFEKSSLTEARFDESQKRAIQMGLDRKRPVVVIQGPPGTGKTSVVTELIERAVLRGERVLATAPTNAAVDNMVERLANAGPSACSVLKCLSVIFIWLRPLRILRGPEARNQGSTLAKCAEKFAIYSTYLTMLEGY